MSKQTTKDDGIRFRCEPELKRDLKKLAKERHTTVAQLVREAAAREVAARKGK
jgi:predicted DNA-binding protein